MTAKFKQIIDQLNALITFKADKSISDEDFIANIDAINLLCNLHDDLRLDRSEIRRRMSRLYHELTRRIFGKKDLQFAMQLIKALNSFIYGRADDYGPARWRNNLTEMCCKVVDSYCKNPLIDSSDYLYALDTVACMSDDNDTNDIKEYKRIISSYLEDIESVSLPEKVKRVSAYERSKHLFVSDNWEKWAEIREKLKHEDVSSMDDETVLLWCDVTDQYPVSELKKRSANSKRMAVEYLRSQVIFEFAKQKRLRNERKLTRGLKSLNDNIIGDIIPLKIDSGMSVSTLFALETIFYLRLALAQISNEDNNSTYELLCLDRFERIANALEKKYPKAATINEKIEILERLSVIGGEIHSHHEDFAIEEADKLKGLPDLTYAQKLRLDWIPSITSENESEIAAKLLESLSTDNSSFLSPNSSFIMATLALITDHLSDAEREAVLNHYFELFNTALSTNNISELGNLLTLAAYWNSNPSHRPRLTEATNKAASVGALSLPERRVNDIAATIYTQIDNITGKYY
ncbi:MAG: hypothetical protein NC453_11260 [Muribaculum sp.]|nr:hypothetical protein [Muribaculum sp.]